jgi:hypothetical protein
LEKDFEEFIALRCERALEGNEEYMHDEECGEYDQDILGARAQTICYLQGMRDMLQFIGIEETPILNAIGSRGSQNR